MLPFFVPSILFFISPIKGLFLLVRPVPLSPIADSRILFDVFFLEPYTYFVVSSFFQGQNMTPLEELFNQQLLIKDRIRGLVHGNSTGLYLCGSPGTSKTYLVRTTLDALAVQYKVAQGHLTPIGLFSLLAKNPEKIILIDDVSAIFNSPISLQLLLAALGNTHDRSPRVVTYTTADKEKTVEFQGKIICLSNIELNRGGKSEVLAAIRDRINVIAYDPTDDQLIALILHIGAKGLDSVSASDALIVANYLITQCREQAVRPTVRLFCDKAIPDFYLWKKGKSESHWQDLVRSSVKEQVITQTRETRDLSRQERVEAEQRIAVEIYCQTDMRSERIELWKKRTDKSERAFYRRLKEAESAGSIRLST